MPYILTFDIGTTSVKTCIFNEQLKIVSQSAEEYSLLTGPGNVVEVAPKTYLDAVKKGVHRVVTEPGYAEIDAICIATQGETLIPVDRNGQALRNAIVWLDGRAVEEASYIASLPVAKDFYISTGIADIGPAVPVSKLLWIKRHEPEIYENTYKFLLLEDYIILYLTGQFMTDRGIMCTTGYYDVQHDTLHRRMLDALDIDAEKIPEINQCGAIIGKVRGQAAKELGISANAVVVSGAMDQIASAVGAGNIREGMVTEATGTCMAVAGTVDSHIFEKANSMHIYTHVMPGKYLFLYEYITAGIALKWFKDEFCAEEIAEAERTGQSVYDILGGKAEKVPAGSNGLIIVPYLNGVLHPVHKPNVRGVFFGVSLDTKKPEFIRALFEGIGFMLRESIELAKSIGIEVNRIRSLGGGAKSRIWQRIKADITDTPIDTMEEPECTSLGVAILAACALKWYPSIEDACARNTIKHTETPDPGLREIYNQLYHKYLQVYASTRDLY